VVKEEKAVVKEEKAVVNLLAHKDTFANDVIHKKIERYMDSTHCLRAHTQDYQLETELR